MFLKLVPVLFLLFAVVVWFVWNKFFKKSAAVVVTNKAAAPATGSGSSSGNVTAPTPVVTPAPAALTYVTDANGCIPLPGVTEPQFKGFAFSLDFVKAQFDPSSHQFKFIDFNTKQIDGQIQLDAEVGGNFVVQNTCRQVNDVGQDAGTSVANTARAPSTVTSIADATAHFNSLHYTNIAPEGPVSTATGQGLLKKKAEAAAAKAA